MVAAGVTRFRVTIMASLTGASLTLPTEKEALAAGQLLRHLSCCLHVQAETQQLTFIGDAE